MPQDQSPEDEDKHISPKQHALDRLLDILALQVARKYMKEEEERRAATALSISSNSAP